MHAHTLAHLSDDVLLRDLAALVARDRATTAALLAHIAEVDARRLYLPAGHASMHAYCVVGLGLSDDAAAKRIHAARAARRFPELFDALVDGRLHLTAVNLLAPHLAPGNTGELIAAATRRRRPEIELFLARRFAPPPQAPPRAASLRPVVFRPQPQHAPEHVAAGQIDLVPPAEPPVPLGIPPEPDAAPAVASASPARFDLRVTIDERTRAKLQRAQALLGHVVSAGDVAEVLDRALDALIAELEKRKYGATARPRPATRVARGPRTIPAHVRRAVWERDGGSCSFTSAGGQRCGAVRRLEFDHVVPLAQGGGATVDGVRLLCRTHNQYEAERLLGPEFMARRRTTGLAKSTHVTLPGPPPRGALLNSP